MRWPSSAASARCSCASIARSAVSPSIAYSTAGRSSAGVSCATCATRQCAGSSTSPLSACSSPRKSANRLDFPEPLAPIRPMRSPAYTVSSAPSTSGFAPRARVSWENRIKQRFYWLVVLILLPVAAAAQDLRARVRAELEARGLGGEALGIIANVLEHDERAPPRTPAIVSQVLRDPLAGVDAA